jgi:hypothetical protein
VQVLNERLKGKTWKQNTMIYVRAVSTNVKEKRIMDWLREARVSTEARAFSVQNAATSAMKKWRILLRTPKAADTFARPVLRGYQ